MAPIYAPYVRARTDDLGKRRTVKWTRGSAGRFVRAIKHIVDKQLGAFPRACMGLLF